MIRMDTQMISDLFMIFNVSGDGSMSKQEFVFCWNGWIKKVSSSISKLIYDMDVSCIMCEGWRRHSILIFLKLLFNKPNVEVFRPKHTSLTLFINLFRLHPSHSMIKTLEWVSEHIFLFPQTDQDTAKKKDGILHIYVKIRALTISQFIGTTLKPHPVN